MAQQELQHLWSTRTQVQSLAQRSGIRIQHSCSYHVGCNCDSDLIPGPRTTSAMGRQKKKKERGSSRRGVVVNESD